MAKVIFQLPELKPESKNGVYRYAFLNLVLIKVLIFCIFDMLIRYFKKILKQIFFTDAKWTGIKKRILIKHEKKGT